MDNGNRVSEIADRLQHLVETMPTGGKLPGVRDLARELRASAATVSGALSRLSALGLVRAEPGRGTFVTQRPRVIEPDFSWQSQALGPARVDADRAARLGGYGTPGHLPLSWGYLAPELQPLEDVQRLGARVAKRASAWSMTPAAGSPELRRVLAADYDADPDDVLVVSGGQQGLVFAMRTLAEPGTTMITESPSYPGAILAAQSAGLTVASVPADEHGIRTDRLADALERTRAQVIYLQPSYANPTGVVLSARRRAEVHELAHTHGAFVIEDDWARHLGLDDQTPPPLYSSDQDGHVVTVLTLSKSASPGLCLGAVLARGPAGQRLRASRTADDICVAPLAQELAYDLLTSPAWPRHLRRLRGELTTRRDALLAALGTSLPAAQVTTVPRGGLHTWIRLPAGANTQTIAARAYDAGILIGDGRHFFVDEPPAPFVRLSYGAATPAQMAQGVRRLAELTG